MRVHVLDEAETELREAIEYYDEVQPGLGVRLKEEVREHFAKIVEAPERPRVRAGGHRRINLRVFPYYIAYLLDGDTIQIVAIAHSHRRPAYWSERRRKGSGPGGSE